MAKLTVGIDLSGRHLTTDIPSTTHAAGTKIIARTDKGNYIGETYQADTTTGYYHFGGTGGTSLVFYSKTGDNDPSVDWNEFTCPDDFGVITEVDETAVLFPYIMREANERAYLMGEDKARIEGYSKDQIDAIALGPTGVLLANGFSVGVAKAVKVAGYNWLLILAMVSNRYMSISIPMTYIKAFPNGRDFFAVGPYTSWVKFNTTYDSSTEKVSLKITEVTYADNVTSCNLFVYGMR